MSFQGLQKQEVIIIRNLRGLKNLWHSSPSFRWFSWSLKKFSSCKALHWSLCKYSLFLGICQYVILLYRHQVGSLGNLHGPESIKDWITPRGKLLEKNTKRAETIGNKSGYPSRLQAYNHRRRLLSTPWHIHTWTSLRPADVASIWMPHAKIEPWVSHNLGY